MLGARGALARGGSPRGGDARRVASRDDGPAARGGARGAERGGVGDRGGAPGVVLAEGLGAASHRGGARGGRVRVRRGSSGGRRGRPSGDPGGDADADAARLRAARLIAVAAEAAPEKCGDPAVAGPLCAALADAASSRTPAPPAPLPPLVETALEALVAVLDAAGEAADERRGDVVGSDAADLPPDPSLVALVPHACASLRRAWLPAAWGLDAWASPRGAACAGTPTCSRTGWAFKEGSGTRTTTPAPRGHRRRAAWATRLGSSRSPYSTAPTRSAGTRCRSARWSPRTRRFSGSGTRGRRRRRRLRFFASPRRRAR